MEEEIAKELRGKDIKNKIRGSLCLIWRKKIFMREYIRKQKGRIIVRFGLGNEIMKGRDLTSCVGKTYCAPRLLYAS